jgi:hypothetical protein
MSIINKEELKKYKEAGWELVAPGQGIWPVPNGLAAVENIDLANYPGAQFVQLAHEGNCSHFILYPVDAVEFAQQWIDELLDETFYKLRLGIDCYEVRFDEHSPHASLIVRPFAAKLDFIAQVIETHGGTISFDKKRQNGLFEVNYETKCTSQNRQEHLDEIASFEEIVTKSFEASSFVNGFGFAVIAKDIIDCKTMWRTGRPQGRVDFELEHVEPVFNKLCVGSRDNTAIQRLAELNAITSHRAQIIFGYEAVVTLLRDKIEQHRGDAFRLSPSNKKEFKQELGKWIQQWADTNKVELSEERLASLELSPHTILNDGHLSTTKYCVLAAFSDCLEDEDADREYLELLYDARNAYAHNRRDNLTVEQLTSVLRVLRKLLTTIASM